MRHNAWRIIAALTVGALATLGLIGGAGAASAAPTTPPAYPPPVCASLAVSSTAPAVGEAITVTGVNFLPNVTVGLLLKPRPGLNSTARNFPLPPARSDANGRFSVQVTMPSGTIGNGNYLLVATSGAPNGNSCPADPVVDLSIGAATAGNGTNTGINTSTPTSEGGTAFTGVNVALMLIAAAALIVVGFVVNARGRRRHASIH